MTPMWPEPGTTRRESRAAEAADRGPGEDVDPLHAHIAAEAVDLLSQAQLVADKCIADAEQYARDLVMTARAQYRDILQRAEDSATSASSALADETAGYTTPIPEVEYVRTYAQVARVQLRSVLDALTEQVDRLGELPQLNRPRPASLTDLDPFGDLDREADDLLR
ncbi:hypothetical protein [Thalassiella azotivora]